MILSIDPGLRYTGWALGDGNELVQCGSAEGGAGTIWDRACRISTALDWFAQTRQQPLHLVAEKPQVYTQTKSKGDPNDLVDLSVLLGCIVRAVNPDSAKFVLPREWKGTIPKHKRLSEYVIHKRLLKRFSEEELAVYKTGLRSCIPSQQHNICDAVGILFWFFRRSNR